MIQIIKYGTKKTRICNFCGCLFSYEAEDVKVRESKFHGGGDYKYIGCPQCKREITIEQTREKE